MFPLPIAGIALQLLGALSQQSAQSKQTAGDLPPSAETPPALPALPQAGGVDINTMASMLTLLHLAQPQTTQQVSTPPAVLQPAPKLPWLVSAVIIIVIVGFFASLAGFAATTTVGGQIDAQLLVGFGASIFAFAMAVTYVIGSSLGSWIKNVNAFGSQPQPASQPQPQPAPLPLPIPTPPVVITPPPPPVTSELPAPPEPKPEPPPATEPTGPFAASPPWFRNALHEIGTHEVGNNSGADIRRYIAMAHAGSEGDPWCAIFACAMLEHAGVRSPRSASSQSFRSDPNFVQLSGPAPGAIVVFWRGSKSSGLGHVGFYRGENSDRVWTLGGNENDMVQIEALPKASGSFGLVGYYWPRSVPLPTIGPIGMPAGSPSSIKKDPTGGAPSTPSTPTKPEGDWIENIIATVWSDKTTAYPPYGPVDDKSYAVALPAHRMGGRKVIVRSAADKSLVSPPAEVVDVGPWNGLTLATDDPYWETGTRPQAESGTDKSGRRTNLAGIDLTTALAELVRIDGKGKVDWKFAPSDASEPKVT